jgi:hypothetical protein
LTFVIICTIAQNETLLRHYSSVIRSGVKQESLVSSLCSVLATGWNSSDIASQEMICSESVSSADFGTADIADVW